MIRTCEICGNQFSVKPAKVKAGGGRFCSPPCYHQWLKTRTGKDHPLYGKVKRVCKNCGESFEAHPSEIEKGNALYCSKQCHYEMRPSLIDTKCLACGKPIKVHLSKLRRNINGAFCSVNCVGDWTHENQRGENHPGWCGGISDHAYPREFRNKRDDIKARDSYQCRVCGSNQNLLIHHIDDDPLNNDDSNLVTVCAKCHRGPIHARKEITFDGTGKPVYCKQKA